VPEAAMPRPTPVKIAPPASPRRAAGTCASTTGAASTVSTPPATPAANRQTKNHEKGSGAAHAKNAAVATNIMERNRVAVGTEAAVRRASRAPAR
jgi:hypothetical protein